MKSLANLIAKKAGKKTKLILLVMFFPIFLLLLLEIIFRLFFSRLVPSDDIPRQNIGGALQLKPNITLNLATEEFRNTITTNPHGFNDLERSYAKPSGKFRIIVLGDSFVEAVQVPREKNLCSVIEKEMGKNTEVINMGIAGAGQAQEYLILQQESLKYSPDFVVICFFLGNDVYNNSYILESKKEKLFFYLDKKSKKLLILEGGNTPPKNSLLENPLWKISFLYRYIVKKIMEYQEISSIIDPETGVIEPTLVFRQNDPLAWKEAWDITEALLLEIRKITRQNGAELVLVFIPDKIQVYEQAREAALKKGILWDIEKPNKILAEFCINSNIEYIDLLPEFKKLTGEGKRIYFKKDEHFTEEGHLWAGKIIANKIKEIISRKVN